MTDFARKGRDEGQPGAAENDHEKPTLRKFIPVQFSDTMAQSKIESSPLGRTLTMDLSDLPKVQAPSLEGLSVSLPAPTPVSEEDLLDLWAQRAYESAPRVPRKVGEAVRQGDEIIVDIFGYAHGKFLPFSARRDLIMPLLPDPLLPGLFEGLVGCPVGELQTIQLTLPEDYPREDWAGLSVAFVIDLKAASAVSLPDLEDPDLPAALGLGDDFDSAFSQLFDELTQARLDEWNQEATLRLLEELVRRAKVVVPASLITMEIEQQWRTHEGQILAEAGVEQDDLEASLEGWRTDMALQMEARRRLGIALVLRAIAETDDFSFSPEEFEDFLEEIAAQLGQTPTALRESLRDDPHSRDILLDKFIHLRAIEYVLAHATVEMTETS